MKEEKTFMQLVPMVVEQTSRGKGLTISIHVF